MNVIKYSNIPLWLSITSPYRWKVEKIIGRSIYDVGSFKEYRMRKGYRIRDVMEITGLSKPTIVNIERQKTRGVSATTWLRLTIFYGEITESLYIIKGRNVKEMCKNESFIHDMTIQDAAKYILKWGVI